MENSQNRQYEAMHAAAVQKLAGISPAELAEKYGFSWDGTAFAAQTLGIPIRVTFPDYRIEPQLDLWHDLTILQYLANGTGRRPTGKFCAMSAFAAGGLVRGSSFERENEAIFRRIGAHSGDEIRQAAQALGGKEVPGKADLCFLFSFLPRIPVRVNLWLADEEFPASGKVLFDASAEQELQVEAAGTAAGILLQLWESRL